MTQIQLQAKKAIDLTNLQAAGRQAARLKLDKGTYTVALSTDVSFHYRQAPCNQVLLFNSNPVQDGLPYAIVSPQQSVQIEVKSDNTPVFAFLVDQMATFDNIGSATVTFTKL